MFASYFYNLPALQLRGGSIGSTLSYNAMLIEGAKLARSAWFWLALVVSNWLYLLQLLQTDGLQLLVVTKGVQ